jgi:hypothetical protein
MASLSQRQQDFSLVHVADLANKFSKPLDNLIRTSEFWARASAVYAAYKVTQVRVDITLYCSHCKAFARSSQQVKDKKHISVTTSPFPVNRRPGYINFLGC